MTVLFSLIALLSLLSFLLKTSFFPRGGTATASFVLAFCVFTLIPWLTRQPADMLADWVSSPGRVRDGTVCIVLEALLMTAFCFARPSGRLPWLKYYPGLLAIPFTCLGWAQFLFSHPGLDFGRFAWTAALITLSAAFCFSRLLYRLVPEQEPRLEGLFLINLFLLLLAIVATGAINY